MSAFFRAIVRRQQHMAYFVICFLLFALAAALAKPAGWWAVIAFWIALVGVLELVYRWTIAVGRRNRRTWWAKPRGRRFSLAWRTWIYLLLVVAGLMIRRPFLFYGFLALLVAGLLCAGVIRWMGRHDQV